MAKELIIGIFKKMPLLFEAALGEEKPEEEPVRGNLLDCALTLARYYGQIRKGLYTRD